jgi:hypothetical protein
MIFDRRSPIDRRSTAVISFLLLLSGCASMEPSRLVQRKLEPIAPTAQRVALPQANVESVTELGNSMISGGLLFSLPALTLATQIAHQGVSKGPYTLILLAGTYVATGRSSWPIPGTFFQFPQLLRFTAHTSGLSRGGQAAVKGGVFVPDLKDGTPQIYWHATDSGVPLTDPDPSLQFEMTTHEEFKKDSFYRELVYNGKTGGTIKLIYREFADNRIRPAFTQEVTYDLDQGTTIGFKGARFEVHSADNIEIRYTVLSHFE